MRVFHCIYIVTFSCDELIGYLIQSIYYKGCYVVILSYAKTYHYIKYLPTFRLWDYLSLEIDLILILYIVQYIHKNYIPHDTTGSTKTVKSLDKYLKDLSQVIFSFMVYFLCCVFLFSFQQTNGCTEIKEPC